MERPLSAYRRLESAMTEEEFKALLKVKEDSAMLEITEEVVYTAVLKFKYGGGGYWATSTSKEQAINDLVDQYFGEKSANN